MNTKPAEELLALWVEDELHGADLATVDAWASAQPEWLGYREDARRTRSLLRQVLPAVEEPPYADFFNSRIAREIASAREEVPVKAPSRNWLAWFVPTAAAAGMALCFWAGTHVSTSPSGMAGTGDAAPVAPQPYLYTPESGVEANWYASTEARASVIVLDGVAAIPDTFEIPDTAAIQDELPATAEAGTQR